MVDAADGIPAAVYDMVIVRIGCNCVLVFAAVNCRRGRGLFSFKCCYPDCSAFLDVRLSNTTTSSRGSSLGLAPNDFAAFPPRLPRSTFTESHGGDPAHGCAEPLERRNRHDKQRADFEDMNRDRALKQTRTSPKTCSCFDDMETNQVGNGQSWPY